MWTAWQVVCLIGYWAGNVIPVAWSLDFVVPLCFLALLVPALEDHATRVAALAAGFAVVALDALPMRLSLICAGLVGIAAGMIAESAPEHAMSTTLAWWTVIVVVGTLNYLSRLSFVAVSRGWRCRRSLRARCGSCRRRC